MDRVGIRFSPNVYVQGVEDGDPFALFGAVAKRLEELNVPWIELREPRLQTAAGAIPTAPVSPVVRAHFSNRSIRAGWRIESSDQTTTTGGGILVMDGSRALLLCAGKQA